MPDDSKSAPSPVTSVVDFASTLISRAMLYAAEGLAVALAAYWFPRYMGGKALPMSQIGMIALVAIATFATLDYAAPAVLAGARQGAGFGIGAGLVGFPA